MISATTNIQLPIQCCCWSIDGPSINPSIDRRSTHWSTFNRPSIDPLIDHRRSTHRSTHWSTIDRPSIELCPVQLDTSRRIMYCVRAAVSYTTICRSSTSFLVSRLGTHRWHTCASHGNVPHRAYRRSNRLESVEELSVDDIDANIFTNCYIIWSHTKLCSISIRQFQLSQPDLDFRKL